MTDLRKAAEMALEALNEVTGWQWSGPMRVMDEVEDAIQALRQALAQHQDELKHALEEEWRNGYRVGRLEKRERSEPREWVGLTDAERKACWHDSLGFYRTIETASKEMERILKEKNT